MTLLPTPFRWRKNTKLAFFQAKKKVATKIKVVFISKIFLKKNIYVLQKRRPANSPTVKNPPMARGLRPRWSPQFLFQAQMTNLGIYVWCENGGIFWDLEFWVNFFGCLCVFLVEFSIYICIICSIFFLNVFWRLVNFRVNPTLVDFWDSHSGSFGWKARIVSALSVPIGGENDRLDRWLPAARYGVFFLPQNWKHPSKHALFGFLFLSSMLDIAWKMTVCWVQLVLISSWCNFLYDFKAQGELSFFNLTRSPGQI